MSRSLVVAAPWLCATIRKLETRIEYLETTIAHAPSSATPRITLSLDSLLPQKMMSSCQIAIFQTFNANSETQLEETTVALTDAKALKADDKSTADEQKMMS